MELEWRGGFELEKGDLVNKVMGSGVTCRVREGRAAIVFLLLFNLGGLKM